jgi:hypothetical protein
MPSPSQPLYVDCAKSIYCLKTSFYMIKFNSISRQQSIYLNRKLNFIRIISLLNSILMLKIYFVQVQVLYNQLILSLEWSLNFRIWIITSEVSCFCLGERECHIWNRYSERLASKISGSTTATSIQKVPQKDRSRRLPEQVRLAWYVPQTGKRWFWVWLMHMY